MIERSLVDPPAERLQGTGKMFGRFLKEIPKFVRQRARRRQPVHVRWLGRVRRVVDEQYEPAIRLVLKRSRQERPAPDLKVLLLRGHEHGHRGCMVTMKEAVELFLSGCLVVEEPAQMPATSHPDRRARRR
jgi:hypothetical protein